MMMIVSSREGLLTPNISLDLLICYVLKVERYLPSGKGFCVLYKLPRWGIDGM
jgi:hypothetical protein